MSVEEKTLEERLMKGARIIGELWRLKERCPKGFAPEECACEKKTRFCKAKAQWLGLAFADARESVEGEYDLALMMKGLEWDATGLTLKWDLEGVGLIHVGSKGNLKMADLLALMENPESARSVLGLMKSFPGSQVQSIAAPQPVEASVEIPSQE
jgi:hypothetical protein